MERRLRKFIVLVLGVLAYWSGVSLAEGPSQAVDEPWRKLHQCQDNELVVDRYVASAHLDFFQLVIRKPSLVEQIRKSDAVLYYRFNERGEVILPLLQTHENSIENFIGEHDANRVDGRLYTVAIKDGVLSFTSYRTSVTPASGERSGNGYQTEEILLEAAVSDCHWVN